MNSIIKTEKLVKIFQTEEVETIALNGVDIEVKEGEFVAIMGPSGCASLPCSISLACWTISLRDSTSWLARMYLK